MSLNDRLHSFWHPVCWASDLTQRPYGTTLLGTRLVLWRSSGGVVAASDQCPHRGTQLSLGEITASGELACPYHGWTFDGAGACTAIPQLPPGAPIPRRAEIETFLVAERFGLVWVCLGEPEAPIPDFPEWADPTYRHVACATYTWKASAGRMVENFTDFGHLGYLHDGLLGTRDALVVPEHRVERRGLELHYELTMEVPNTNSEYAVTDVQGDRGLQTNFYVLSLPFTIHLRCRYGDTGAFRTLFFAAQPNDDGTSSGYCYQSRNFDLEAPDAPFAEFQEVLALQDQPIVESQPTELPLRLTDELHMPFDRVAVAYRRAMAELSGIEHGAPAQRALVEA